ncbi:hypothetical protein, partial [Dolichospermum sp. UHCC 0259]|uniref:hypothetical protein n=1 Tax=Dolichospermum sp. UHCC 0259 TaxID=2590010 RepID=UPI00144599D6
NSPPILSQIHNFLLDRPLGLDISYTRQPIQLFDGKPFNADDPISYLNDLEIKRDFSIAEVILDAPRKTAA